MSCSYTVGCAHVLMVVSTYAGSLTATASVLLNLTYAPHPPLHSLPTRRSSDLPLNGTSTQVTVGFVTGTPTLVELSRDGQPVFATYPTGSSFTLSAEDR